MRVLLLMFDARRRGQLADACRAVSTAVECIESDDEVGEVLAVAPDRFDLVALDTALLKRRGAANLVNWWRSVPCGELVMLDADPRTDFERIRPMLLKALD